jgi:HTH-type transcriptional regulator/antitoxin HigA
MVDRLSNEYLPDYVSPPGETLAEVLEVRTMTQSELASRAGRTAKHINEIIGGRAPITPETAIQFERVLGIPARFWNSRQGAYNEFLAREKEDLSIRENLEWASLFPYKKMAKLGWVQDVRDRVDRLRNLLNYFGVASPDAWMSYWDNVRAAYRVSQSYEPDPYALAAWLRQGELVGQQCRCQPYDELRFRNHLVGIRKLTLEATSVFQHQLINRCSECGVAVAFVRELPKTASGATRWLTSEKALIQLSLRYKTDDQLWFTFFHEAAHILMHQKRGIFIEGGAKSSKEETEANQFAADFLIPPDSYASMKSRTTISFETIRAFAAELGIAPGIIVGRLQHDGRLGHGQGNRLKRFLIWKSENG